MTKLVLTEYYPRQQTLTSVGKQFANRLNEFFGGGWLIDKHEVLSSSDWQQEEYVELSNGRQMNIELTRSEESFEIKASASYIFNSDYLTKITEQDIDYLSDLVANNGKDIAVMKDWETYNYLYHLATNRFVQLFFVPGVSEPLTEAAKQEENHLSFLVPKLMIITGQAKEKNFHYEEVTE